MQGGNLKCNATNCLHNKERECKAGAINVTGHSAVTIEGTACTTFVDESSGSFVNSIDDLTTETSNIKCEAHHCKYNENRGCHADNVQIDAYNARCDTFDCEKFE